MTLVQLQDRPKLVSSVVTYEHRVIGNVEQHKAIAQLIDGSRLHINEVWLNGVLEKYAYYWLTLNGTLIQGWDNAPHHRQIATFPHHTHKLGQVQPSVIRTLAAVLDELESRLTGSFAT